MELLSRYKVDIWINECVEIGDRFFFPETHIVMKDTILTHVNECSD